MGPSVGISYCCCEVWFVSKNNETTSFVFCGAVNIYVLFSDNESDQELWWKVASCGGNLSAPADCISVDVLLDMHDL